MYQEIFEGLGLSPNEARIYETLLERGESSVSDVSIAAKVHRRNAYDAIQRLIDKGLAFQIFSSKENLYNAVDPDKLSELVAEKREKLEEIMPALRKKFEGRFASEEAYIYRGLEGQRNIWRIMLNVSNEYYFIGAKGGYFDPGLETARKMFFKEANRKKAKFIQLFDHEVGMRDPEFAKQYPGNVRYRFLPKKYSTTSGIGIFGDYVITHTGLNNLFKTDENTVFFVIHSKNLADSYRTWFWYMWNQSQDYQSKRIKR